MKTRIKWIQAVVMLQPQVKVSCSQWKNSGNNHDFGQVDLQGLTGPRTKKVAIRPSFPEMFAAFSIGVDHFHINFFVLEIAKHPPSWGVENRRCPRKNRL